MFNIGTGELLVIALLALLVLGPDKLPQAARQIGQFTSEARKIANGFRHEMKSALDDAADAAEINPRKNGKKLAAPPTDAKPIDPGQPLDLRPINGSAPTPDTDGSDAARGDADRDTGADERADS